MHILDKHITSYFKDMYTLPVPILKGFLFIHSRMFVSGLPVFRTGELETGVAIHSSKASESREAVSHHSLLRWMNAPKEK